MTCMPERELTVGIDEGDVRGATGRAIQVALDALAFRGGGTVRVLPGTYTLLDSIRLRPRTALIGDRAGTILRRRGPVAWSPLTVDADVGQTEITPAHPDRFEPGMGVCRWDRAVGWQAADTALWITRIEDGVLHLSDYITLDVRAENDGRVINWFPMIYGEGSEQVHVEGFTLDAAVEDPDGVLDGKRTAAVYLFRCRDAVLRGLTVTGNCGDGICFGKTSERTVVEDCETAHNGYYGIHPGSHSAHSAVRRCHIHHNCADGLYICWGIRHGEITDNHIHHNGWGMLRSGISIGHKDTDNLIARNRIHDNAKYGICFRAKTEANGPHRCTVRGNTIENNGSSADELAAIKVRLPAAEAVGCGIDVFGINHGLVLEGNVIRETRSAGEARQRVGVWLKPGVADFRIAPDNVIEGHPEDDVRDDTRGGEA